MLEIIFCEMDDFCKFLSKELEVNFLESSKMAGRKPKLTWSEILTITVYYQYSGFKNFKTYYNCYVKIHLKSAFNDLPSYNRFVELMQNAALPLFLFFKLKASSDCTGISIIDSYPLIVCHIKRASSHKVFKKAKKGKTSVGWFFGFKLHIVINNFGEIIDVLLTPGNVADNNKKTVNELTKNIFGKLIGDKGYIGLFKELYEKGIQLIHKIRSNMKNKLMDMFDKLLLKKRGIVESTGNILKNTFNLEHTRHRSEKNFLTNIFSTLIAYYFKSNKPSFGKFNLIN